MDVAVIKTGGKQYLVAPGDKIKIEKVLGKEGKEVKFSDVLLVVKNKKTEIGTPLVKGVKVLGKILKQGRNKKVVIFKYKPKKRYKKKRGHCQLYTQIEITEIISEKDSSTNSKLTKSTTKKADSEKKKNTVRKITKKKIIKTKK